MTLLTPRACYSPFEYQQAYKYWELQQQSHWLHSEISMASDINDWKIILNETEKNVIGHILKGFTQSEVFIQEYWGQMVGKWFKKPEIQMMAACFSSMESIHAVSYAYLNQSLGLEDFDAFLHEPTAKAKIDRLIGTKGKSKEEIARSLAIFSAFNEGVNLFSSFAILLNFSRFNKLKGVGQIISFSIKDECYSADTEILTPTGFKLFKDLRPADKVAQFNPLNNEISFVIPSRIIAQKHTGDMCNFSGEKFCIDIQTTPGHQMLYRLVNKENDNWKFQSAIDFKTNASHKTIPVSGFKKEGRNHLIPHEKFLIAVQADAYVSDRYTGEICGTIPVKFTFAKKRKILRMLDILKETGYSYKTYSRLGNGNKKDQTVFTVDVPVDKLISKTLDWVNLEEVSSEWASEFISEVVAWDGHIPDPSKHSGKYRYYSSKDSVNLDVLQAIASIAGLWTTRSIQEDNRSENYADMHRLYIHEMMEKRLGRVNKTISSYDDMVYCVSVPTSAIVVRRHGAVFVAGNCLHSDAGCWLFRTLASEFPDLMTDTLKEEIYDAARLTVELEDNFISKAFEYGPIEGINVHDLKAFIRFRTNTKLGDLGLKKIWKNIDKRSLENMEWFSYLTHGTSHTDFFSSRVDSYAKGNLDFSTIWE